MNQNEDTQNEDTARSSAERDPTSGTGTPAPTGVGVGPAVTGVQGAPCVVVTFSRADEFIQELRDRGPNVEPMVRLTFRWTRDESGAPLTHLTLLANYLRRLDGEVVSIVHLGQYVGAVWEEGRDERSERYRAEADRLRTLIAQAAGVLGLEVRGGTYFTGRER